MATTPENQIAYEGAFEAMHEACLNAIGAYEALDIGEVSSCLPGLKRCKGHLEKTLKMVDKIKGH